MKPRMIGLPGKATKPKPPKWAKKPEEVESCKVSLMGKSLAEIKQRNNKYYCEVDHAGGHNGKS